MISKTIIIPCYNDNTILEIIERVKNINNNDNIIIVDDGSTDGTRELLSKINNSNIIIKFHENNFGKGKAIQTALSEELKEIIIQDDLEYNPKDYKFLLKPFIETNAEVVYGSRFIGNNEYKDSFVLALFSK